jgi:hypothetical protein
MMPVFSTMPPQLAALRRDINYLRKRERAIVKDWQRACPHPTVTRSIKREVINHTPVFAYTPPRIATEVKIKCAVCGKILSRG